MHKQQVQYPVQLPLVVIREYEALQRRLLHQLRAELLTSSFMSTTSHLRHYPQGFFNTPLRSRKVSAQARRSNSKAVGRVLDKKGILTDSL